MAPRNKGENTKKAAGNAKKAEVAAQKQAAATAQAEQEEASKWSKGAKSNAKAADAAEKKAQQAAAKAERDRLLAEEEKSQPSKPKGAGKKTAEKKTRGTLNLDALDDDDSPQSGSNKERTLNASGIDNALDALDLTANSNTLQLDRHPERRYKAAYKAFEERRLPEIESENPGLRRNQRVEMARREFEKSPENPFNMVGNVAFDAGREEVEEVRRRAREGVEGRLGER
jgi:membrane protein involved in colicin uptake